MADFKSIIEILSKQYGEPERPPAKGPFELVMWENACYLLSDERRAAVFRELQTRVGMDAHAILDADRSLLLELAKKGGMRPETRVFRWREIARITVDQFDGHLERILDEPYEQAKRALKQFPTIGDPGADKILLFCGRASGLPLESNGLRVLTRVGFGRAQKSYGAMYRSVQEDIAAALPKDAASMTQAHLLLRAHGKTICRTNEPSCPICPVLSSCRFGSKKGSG